VVLAFFSRRHALATRAVTALASMDDATLEAAVQKLEGK
jgi:hypothetical protein